MTVYRIISMILHHVLINFMITDICDMKTGNCEILKKMTQNLYFLAICGTF